MGSLLMKCWLAKTLHQGGGEIGQEVVAFNQLEGGRVSSDG